MKKEIEAKRTELKDAQKAFDELQLSSGVTVNNSTSSLNRSSSKDKSRRPSMASLWCHT